MKKIKKSAKLLLVSVISAICVFAIVLGCVVSLQKPDNNGGEDVENIENTELNEGLSWNEKVNLLGKQLNESSVETKSFDIISGEPYAGYVDFDNELVELTDTYFITRNTLTCNETYYAYYIQDNGFVVNKASNVNFCNNGKYIEYERLVSYFDDYVFLESNIYESEDTTILVSVLKNNAGVFSYVMGKEFNIDIDNRIYVQYSGFSKTGEYLFFDVRTINFDGNDNLYKDYLFLANLKTKTFYTLDEFNFESDSNCFVSSQIYESGLLAIVSNDYYIYSVKNGFVQKLKLQFDAKTNYQNCYQLSDSMYVCEFVSDVGYNKNKLSVISATQDSFLNYSYKLISIEKDNISFKNFDMESGVSKLEFERIGKEFYSINKLSVNDSNFLNDNSKIAYYYKDGSLVVDFDIKDQYEKVLYSENGNFLTENKLIKFDSLTSSKNIIEFNEFCEIANPVVNSREFLISYKSGNEYFIAIMDINGEIIRETKDFVCYNDNNEIVTLTDISGIYSDGSNFFINSLCNWFKLDFETLEFHSVGFVFSENFVLTKLMKNNFGFYVTENHNRTLEIKSFAGESLINEVSSYNFVESIDHGAVLELCADGKPYTIKFNSNFIYSTFAELNQDYVTDKKEIQAINAMGKFSGLNQNVNEVSPYGAHTENGSSSATIYYYYGYYGHSTATVTLKHYWYATIFGIHTTDSYYYEFTLLNWNSGWDQGHGWSFLGWTMNEYGTSVDYSAGTTYNTGNIGSDTIKTYWFYCVYSRSVPIYYHVDSNSSTRPSFTWTQYGNAYWYTTTSREVPSTTDLASGWTYRGYGINKNSTVYTNWYGTTNIQPGFTANINSEVDKTFYRNITMNYTGGSSTKGVSGTNSSGNTSYSNTSEVRLSSFHYAGVYQSDAVIADNEFTLTGYRFNGWYCNTSGFTGSKTVGSSFQPYSNVRQSTDTFNFVAQWLANNYTLKISTNTGSYSMSEPSNASLTTYSISCTYDQNITLPTASHVGWTCQGFSDSPTGSVAYSCGSTISHNFTSTHNGEVTIYAIWTANTYTINYNSNKPSNEPYVASSSVSGSMSSTTATYDSDVTLRTNNFSITGWTFQGWAKNSSATSIDYSNGQTISKPNFVTGDSDDDDSYTLYAVWNANKYTIEFAGNSGTIDGLAVISGCTLSGSTFSLTYDTQAKFGVNAKRKGYKFSGWKIYYLNSDGYWYSILRDESFLSSSYSSDYADTTTSLAVAVTAKNITATNNRRIKLTAQWTLIKYYVQLESVSGSTISSLVASSACTLSGSKFEMTYATPASISNYIVRTGYWFTGWSVSGTGATMSTISSANISYTNNNDSSVSIKVQTTATSLSTYSGSTITLTANWTPISYFIDYNSNKPTRASSSITGTVATTTHHYDSTTESITSSVYTLDGWHCLGWATSSSATTPTYTSGQVLNKPNLTYVNGQTFTLYAVWAPNTYYIIFNADGGTTSGLSAPSTNMVSSTKLLANYDTSLTFAMSNIVKAGYKFNGWTVSTGLGSVNSYPTSYPTTSFKDYYEMNSTHSQTTNAISATTTVLNASIVNEQTITFTAKWEAIKYYVTLDKNFSAATLTYPSNAAGANTELSGTSFKATYGLTGTFNIEIQRDGYTFDGWINNGSGTANASYTSNDNTTIATTITTQVTNLTTIHNGTVELDAIWKNINYYIYLNGNGGSFSNHTGTSTVTYSNSMFIATYDVTGTFSVKAVRPGYKFDGWTYTTGLGSQTSKPNSSMYSNYDSYYASNTQTSTSIDVLTEVLNLTKIKGESNAVELTAKWKAIGYNIKYLPNKPTASSSSVTGSTQDSNATYDSPATLSTNGFSLIGWTFLGWSDASNKTVADYPSGDTITRNFTTISDGTVNLYATWRRNNYTIIYALNGGYQSPSGNYPTSATYDNVFKVSVPLRTGYTFEKYTVATFTTNNDKAFGTSSSVLTNLGTAVTTYTVKTDIWCRNLTSTDNGTITFTASWIVNVYNITYNYNGGESSGQNPATSRYDSPFTVSAPTKLGYTFSGWTISAMSTTCTHYYGVDTSSLQTTPASSLDLTNVSIVVFKNLHSENNATVTFTAKWINNVYKISYDYAGGTTKSGLSYPATMTYDQSSTVSNPIRTGYTFINWSITNMSTTCVHYYGTSATTYNSTYATSLTVSTTEVSFKNLHSEVNATVNFRAIWKANVFNLTYNLLKDGLTGAELGTGSFPATATYDITFVVDAPAKAPFGYHFGGWIITGMSTDCSHYYGTSSSSLLATTGASYTTESDVKYFKNLHSTTNAQVTLTANWIANIYNISYVLVDPIKGGDGHFETDAPATSAYDSQFVVPVPVRTGYAFKGWMLSTLSDECTHYFSNDNIPFLSTNNGYYSDTNPNLFKVVNSDTFKNLHYEQGATVTLTASWKADAFTITYHYLSGSFDTSTLSSSNINVYSSTSALTKNQEVEYDGYFTTMKMSKSEIDTTGVVVPNDVMITRWIFYKTALSDGTRIATMDAQDNPVPATSYNLGVGTEQKYNSEELFGNYQIFGGNVHAYAIYAFSNITVKLYGANTKIAYNDPAKYTLKSTLSAKTNNSFTMPSKVGSVNVIGYMISSNIINDGEFNSNSITEYKVNNVTYRAVAGTSVIWGYSSSQAKDPENPTFYLYAIYDCSLLTFFSPSLSMKNVVKFNTSNMFTNGKTYKITVRGLESTDYYDYEYLKLATNYDSTGSACGFDKIYSHTGKTSSTTSTVSGLSTTTNGGNTTTLTITFTANSNCSAYSLYMFFRDSIDVTSTNYLKFLENVEITVREA